MCAWNLWQLRIPPLTALVDAAKFDGDAHAVQHAACVKARLWQLLPSVDSQLRQATRLPTALAGLR
jgi:hypothetical protein